MKCERVLERLETGAPWQRVAARLHVRRCRHCQVACQQLASLKLELSRGEQLDDRRRRKWLAVAGSTPLDGSSRPFRLVFRWAPLGLAGGLIAITALGIWLAIHRPGPSSPIATVVPVSGEQAWLELADVRKGLGELSRELDELAVQVALMDEERQVQELLARYSRDENSMIQRSNQ